MVDGLNGDPSPIPAGLVILPSRRWPIGCSDRGAFALFVVVAFLLIANLGYWTATVQTISLVGFSTINQRCGSACRSALRRRTARWLYTALRPVLDLMQTLPTPLYLIRPSSCLA